jgi:hypothetical protein
MNFKKVFMPRKGWISVSMRENLVGDILKQYAALDPLNPFKSVNDILTRIHSGEYLIVPTKDLVNLFNQKPAATNSLNSR